MKWKISIQEKAENDLAWFRQNNKRLYVKCFDLVREINNEPRKGTGKPERLKYFDREVWSRRISHEHRMIYVIYPDGLRLDIVSCRSHYEGPIG
jgi:toxin YoeB